MIFFHSGSLTAAKIIINTAQIALFSLLIK